MINILRTTRTLNVIIPNLSKLFSSLNLEDLHKEVGISDDSVPKKKRKPKANYNKDMRKYVDSKHSLRDIKKRIPDNLMIMKSNPSSMYIIDKDTACEILTTLKPHLKSFKGQIIEVNAGLGVLTQELINCKFPRLRIYEADSVLHKQLEMMIRNSECDVKLFKANFQMLWVMINLDRKDYNHRVHDLLEGLPTAPWESDPVVKMIATISNKSFITQMMYSVIFQHGICSYGRPELFLIMQPHEFHYLTCGPRDGYDIYRNKSVLFQILFEYTLLLQVPEKSFVPWIKKKSQPKMMKIKQEIKEDAMILVKITPRSDLFQRVPLDLIKPLWYYVEVMLQKRKARLISMIEKWVPGCGVRLIAQGYTIYTECGSLTPEEHLKVFLEFSSWQEFESSSFLSNMESVLYTKICGEIDEEIVFNKSGERKSENESTLKDTLDLDFDISNLDETHCDSLSDDEKDR